MFHSTDSRFVDLFASLPRLAEIRLRADRVQAAAAELAAGGWAGVQILLYDRNGGVRSYRSGLPSLVLLPEAVARGKALFDEVVAHYVVEGIGSIPADELGCLYEYAAAVDEIDHATLLFPLLARERELGLVLLHAANGGEPSRTSLRLWLDIFTNMLASDAQSRLYTEVEPLFARMHGIADTDHMLRLAVSLLATEFATRCIVWQNVDGPARIAAFAPEDAHPPMLDPYEKFGSHDAVHRIDGLAVIPLRVGGKPWGTLAIDEAALASDDLPFIETVARHLELALATATACAEQGRRADEARIMSDASSALLGCTRLEPLAQIATEQARKLVDCTEASLYIATDENFARIGHAAEAIYEQHVAFDDLEWTRKTGKSYLAGDGRSLVVPLREHGASMHGRFAVLVVGRRIGGTPFATADVERLESFGALCATALRNVRLYEEASEANHALSDINAFKDDLLAMFAHDFKGPLTVISGYGELVLEKLSGDERENLAIILRQVKRLATLADDTLALARAQAAGFVLQIEEGELVGFVQDVLRSSFGTQAARIAADGPATPIHAAFDPIAMRHVLENIVGNALKYSSETVAIKLGQEAGDAVVSVRDFGIGIPATELPDIFGRFARASNARRRGISGSGVGLYLAKRLVEQHGGSISVASIEGEGSTFEIRLPLI